jgi:hypothetical protein
MCMIFQLVAVSTETSSALNSGDKMILIGYVS